MHELALCGSIADIVARHAAGRAVDSVRVRIGELRQVVPETLSYGWTMITETSSLAGSVLEIDRVPALLRCDACGTEHGMDDDRLFACPACGGFTVTVLAGEEFLVSSIDVRPVVAT